MASQTFYSDGSDNGSPQERLGGWLDVALVLVIAAAIVGAAFLVAQPVVVNQAASRVAQSVPSAAVQGVASYLAAHNDAAPAEPGQSLVGAPTGAAGCLTAQNVAPASSGPDQGAP